MDAGLRERIEWHARFTAEIRAFFTADGYAEVDTPTLAPYLVPEPSIEVFETTYIPGKGAAQPMWLAPSPELWMKRLLGRGSGRIFQVSRSFRNGDFGSPVHNPEFRLLEWYAEGRDCEESARDTERLFGHLLARGLCRGEEARLAPPFARFTMAEAFARFAGIDLAASQDAEALRAACRGRGLAVGTDCTWEQAFHIAFLTLVEPELPVDRPLVLSDYPSQIPTTARRRTGTPWAETMGALRGWRRGRQLLHGRDRPDHAPRPPRRRGGTAGGGTRGSASRPRARRRVPRRDRRPARARRSVWIAWRCSFAGKRALEGVIFFPFSAIMSPQSDKG